MRFFFRIVLGALGLVLLPFSALAGGFQAHDAILNGKKTVTSKPGEPLRLCIFGDNYTYSGQLDENSYLFIYAKHTSLQPGLIDRSAFEQKVKLSLLPLPWEGGGVSIGGSSNSISQLSFRDAPRQKDGGAFCTHITAPEYPGEYYFEYDPVPLFTKDVVGRLVTFDTILVENPLQVPQINRHISEHRVASLPAVSLRVVDTSDARRTTPPEIYLKVNGRYPSTSSRLIKSGFSEEPVVFNWFTKNAQEYEVQHRFGLFQVDSAWSHWTGQSEATYSFIFPGGHIFRVETRYRERGSAEWVEAGEARFAFTLDKPFVSAGLSKGRFGSLEERPPILTDVAEYYADNRALLISVSEFDHFNDLPYTVLDRDRMAEKLSNLGFEVVSLITEAPDATEIREAVYDFARSIQPGERAVVYFSTHGFQETLTGEPFLASRECNPEQALSTCISLKEIEPILTAAGERAQHLLVIADACSAGLGTIDKSFYERAILDEKGIHFMTAGLANQVAQIDTTSGQSVFTAEFLRGLDGLADANDDSVISLLEIFHFVRTEVSRATDGAQIPSIGRLRGSGEMMFGVVN